uniref:Uncharacterized protein n=1 Tax=Spermophilus dauricus TaxID=99837 RepID=A0A8C9QAU3_SPEDA
VVIFSRTRILFACLCLDTLTSVLGFVFYRERINATRELEPVELQNCHLIEGLENGSEDIDILPSGLAFISNVSISRLF